jgi:hypothetical protein
MKCAVVATILVFASSIASAQTPPVNSNAKTPAVASPDTINPGAPVAGANSFTESQAKSRMKAAGYTTVTGLAKDKDGVWHGKAIKAGAPMDVTLDYQGNVTAK